MGFMMQGKKHHFPQEGFTLLEVIIAMTIFAVVMVIVMSGLNMVVRSQEQVSAKSKRLAEIQMAFTVMEHDLMQIVDRAVRDTNGELTPVINVDPQSPIRLEFTSGGNVNPNAQYQRSTLRRVGYGLENETLIRYTWPVLDRAPTTNVARKRLLSGVLGFNIEYINQRGEYVNNLTDAIALYIDIDLGKAGHYQRTFPLYNGVINVSR